MIGTYHPSEEMIVKLYPKLFQAAFEIRGATFFQGKCQGHNRITGQSASILFPVNDRRNISIHSVWAKGYSSGVKLVPPFFLYPLTISGPSKVTEEEL